MKTSKCDNLHLSSNTVHPRQQIHPNIQSAAPKPQHEATGPCCTRYHYQEELQNSSCWQFPFKNLKTSPGEPLGSPFQLFLGSYMCPGLHSTLAALRWSPPQFFTRDGDPSSGHTVQDNTALMCDQNTLSPSFLTLATLLFFTASSHQHQVSFQSTINMLVNLSYAANSKNIFINIWLLILLCTLLFQSATQYKEKTQPDSVSRVHWNKKDVQCPFSIQQLKGLSCGMSTQNIPSKMLLLLISLKMSPLTFNVKAFLVPLLSRFLSLTA